MKSHYRKLGLLMKKVDKRNKDLAVDNLKGLSMAKEFRGSTSNIVGTDMSKYKIVEQWQFACDFMSVIRVHAFPVVLNFDVAPVLVSPAYPVFKITDTELLDPEYLMMWFRRSEFDRYADFKCDSAIRGGFGWDELCDIELPVPSIEKQREIVREYNVVNDRITLNEQQIKKLEDTAQAIYKQCFVDFEFSVSKDYAEFIGKPELEDKPYKSSNGEMEYSAEIDTEIPKGWGVYTMDEISDVIDSMHRTPTYSISGRSMVRVTDVNGSYLDLTDTLKVDDGVFDEFTSKYTPKKGDIVLTRVGTYGVCSYVGTESPFCLGQNTVVINPQRILGALLFPILKSNFVKGQIEEGVTGSTQKTISLKLIRQLKLILPKNSNWLLDVQMSFSSIANRGQLLTEENSKLCLMREILLSRLSKA